PIRLSFKLEPERKHAGDLGYYGRDLQGGVGWHRAREIRPSRQVGARIPGGAHDGLPQSERGHCGRDRVVAGAETDSQANFGRRCDQDRTRRTPVKHANYAMRVLLAAMSMASAVAQNEVPENKFDSVPNALQPPAGVYLGEVAGVATNSRGDVFVYTRTGHPTITIGTARPFAHGGSRLFQFDRSGKFVREIGKDSYGFMYAAQVRVDPSDNIWVVDQQTSMVIKFDPQGRLVMLLGRKAESVPVPARPASGNGTGQPTDLFEQPTDVAW